MSTMNGAAPRLTPREAEVLTLIAAGLSNKEIADRLFLSVNSVKTHVRGAYRKIGVSRRVEAVRWALTQDLAGVAPAAPDAPDDADAVGVSA